MNVWSRRDFLKTATAAGAAVSLPSFLHGHQTRDTVIISILHTTDLHGHILPTSDYDGNADVGGFARCATQIRRWRRQNRNSVLIDVGDVYQGTDVSLRNRGELMIDLFNHFRYDAWVVGNHEFDWGFDVFRNAIARSGMPVLAANVLINGTAAGQTSEADRVLAKIRPFITKQFEEIKLAIIGVTTPGMQFWFRPEFTGGLEFPSPIESVRRAIAVAMAAGANAIVIAGHMGLKLRSGGDDFANAIMALTSEFPEVCVFIAGHTHQLVPSQLTNAALVSQADHYGIHVGRIDLTFDRESKRLIDRAARCERMDSRVRMDHSVVSRAQSQLEQSAAALAEPIGELAKTLHARGRSAEPSGIETLIGAAVMEALDERGVQVDGVFHGVFDESLSLPAGPVTVRDIWNVIPYENFLVTAQLTPAEIKMVMEEAYSSHEERNLIGFKIDATGRGSGRRVKAISLKGRPIERQQRCSIAFNTFDSRSGGHRFMNLKALLERPESNCVFYPVQTREALIDYFRTHRVVGELGGNREISQLPKRLIARNYA
jgi:2',3'-cyclic-nucleotide 2'-phosphodiesterase/3'-nucleotidase